MKKEKLFNAIGQIDENLIADAFEEKTIASAKREIRLKRKRIVQRTDCGVGGMRRSGVVRRRDNSFCDREYRSRNGDNGNQPRS